MVLWADNEDTGATDLRMRSSEYSDVNLRPYLEVEYSLPSLAKTLYIKDHLGSSRVVVREDGSVKEAYDYYPFGLKMPGRTFVSGTVVTKNLFTGKERDAETNWDYFGARYYDPVRGQWLAVDPRADDRPWESPYIYTGNNPVNRTDKDGEFWQIVVGAGIGAAISGGLEYLNQISDGNITDLNSYDFSTDVDWSKVGAASAEGAINGAVVAATGGAGLVTTTAATATGGVAGGMVKRAVNGDAIIDPVQMATDAVANGTGGVVANKVTLVAKNLTTSTAGKVVTQKVGAKVTEKVAKATVSASRSTVKTVVKKIAKTIQDTIDGNEKKEVIDKEQN